jgi:hypothetical protein
MVEDYNLIVHLRSHVGSINANAFGKFMLDGSRSMLIAPVLSEERGVGEVAGTPRSSRSHRSQVTSVVAVAIARSLASALERETAVCFLVFQAIKEGPRKTQ